MSDLMALATDTHKFESRYLDQLVGEYPPPGRGEDARETGRWRRDGVWVPEDRAHVYV